MSAELIAALDAEFARRRDGPICARCQHSPLEPADLSPLGPVSEEQLRKLKVREFFCEVRQRRHAADGGRGCGHFVMKQP